LQIKKQISFKNIALRKHMLNTGNQSLICGQENLKIEEVVDRRDMKESCFSIRNTGYWSNVHSSKPRFMVQINLMTMISFIITLGEIM